MLEKVKSKLSEVKNKAVTAFFDKGYKAMTGAGVAGTALAVLTKPVGAEGFTVAGTLAEVTSGFGTVWEVCTSNPFLTFCVGCSAFGLLCGCTRRGRRAFH